jgi:hypothetical protein
MAPVESVTKDIFQPDEYLLLRLNVGLGAKDMSSRRKMFANIRSYNSSWYKDTPQLSTMYIQTNDFLFLESYMPYQKRMETPEWKARRIIFSYETIHLFDNILSAAYSWLNLNNPKVFRRDKDGVDFLNTTSVPKVYCETHYKKQMQEQYLTLTPTIKLNQFGVNERAIMFNFGQNPSIQITSLNTYQVGSLLYFLQHFNLFEAAALTVNQFLLAYGYAKQQNG